MIHSCERLADLLIDAGADVNIPDNEGNFPLHYAILKPYETTLPNQLLDAGADINCRNKLGQVTFGSIQRIVFSLLTLNFQTPLWLGLKENYNCCYCLFKVWLFQINPFNPLTLFRKKKEMARSSYSRQRRDEAHRYPQELEFSEAGLIHETIRSVAYCKNSPCCSP